MAMNGSITEMSLVDLIQLACMERYTARLSVTRDGESARVFFANGEIVHAEVGDRKGPDALYEVVGWTQGDFKLDRGVETAEATIQGTWTAHLLEALVRIDHGNRDLADGDGSESGAQIRSAAPARGSEEVSSGMTPMPDPAKPAESEGWLSTLRTLKGVRQLVLVRTDGLPHEMSVGDQDEQESALTAFIGNASRGIGKTMNFGALRRAQVQVSGVSRVVLASDDFYVGLKISNDLNTHHVALEAQQVLEGRES